MRQLSPGARVVVLEHAAHKPALCCRAAPATAHRVAVALDADLANLGRSARSKYSAGMRQLAEFLSQATADGALLHLVALGPAEARLRLLAWRDTMLAAGLATSTVAGRLSAVRHAWRVMQEADMVDWNLTVPGPAVPVASGARGPSVGDMQRVLSAALEQPGERAQRDHALVLLFAFVGLRRNEVAAMNVEDFDGVGHRLRIPGAGRRGVDWVGAPAAVVGSLGAYLNQRGARWGEALIMNLDRRDQVRGRLSESGIHCAVVRLGELAGLPIRLSPRQLRRFAYPRVTFGPDAQQARSIRAASRHQHAAGWAGASATGAVR
ncbi:MAG: hypothetical protein H6716_20800 [Polyangiaceae bacterium]|nr:hypothetical protein [Polyangiaceae bacterium]